MTIPAWTPPSGSSWNNLDLYLRTDNPPNEPLSIEQGDENKTNSETALNWLGSRVMGYTYIYGYSTVVNTSAAAGNASIVTADDKQILRREGSSLGFGSIDISAAAAVGTSVLRTANGGTGLSTIGSALQYLRVNAGGTGLEYANFPSLTGYVPYTGATADLNMGAFSVSATDLRATGLVYSDKIQANTTNGSNIILRGFSTGFINTYYDAFVFSGVNDFLFTSTFLQTGITANRSYIVPDADGTIALLSDIPSVSGFISGSGTSGTFPIFTGTQAIGNSVLTYNSGSIFASLSTGFGGVNYVAQHSGAATTNSAGFQATTQTGVDMRMVAANDGTGAYIGTFSNDKLDIYTNSAVVATVLANGNVGIGTFANPSTDINSRFHFNGSYSTSGYVGKTDSYALQATDYIVTFGISTAKKCTVPVYSTSNFGAGKRFVIRNLSSSLANLTVQLSGADVFDVSGGATSLTLAPNQSVEIVSFNNSVWSVLSSGINSGISGTLTSGYVPVANGTASLSNSSMYFDSINKRFGIGITTPFGPFQIVSVLDEAAARVYSATTGGNVYNTDGSMVVRNYSNISTFGGIIDLQRARGTIASPTQVLSGDTLGAIFGKGYLNSGFYSNNVVGIRFIAQDNFTVTAQGTSIELLTTPTGTTLHNVVLTLTEAGNTIVTNRLGIGTGSTTPTNRLHILNASNSPAARFQVQSTTDTDGIITCQNYGNVAAFGATISLQRARGTIASPTQVLANDALGGLFAKGYTSSDAFSPNVGAIRIMAFQDFNGAQNGTYIDFATTPNNSSTSSVRMTLAEDGSLLLNTTTRAGFLLDVNGTARIQDNLTISDAKNIILASTTGTKIGTATTQKLSLWNATPDVQPTTTITAATFVANTSGIVNDTATFGGYTIGQVVAALKRIGALA